MFPFGNKNKIYYVYSFNRQKYFYAYVNILGGQHLFWVLRLSRGFDNVKKWITDLCSSSLWKWIAYQIFNVSICFSLVPYDEPYFILGAKI